MRTTLNDPQIVLVRVLTRLDAEAQHLSIIEPYNVNPEGLVGVRKNGHIISSRTGF